MTDRPILFSGPMVRALLGDRKTQTRRIAKPVKGVTFADLDWQPNPAGIGRIGSITREQVAVPYAAGDRLWVREAITKGWGGGTCYPSNSWASERRWPSHWTRDKAVAMHMPRAFSRLTLMVTEVRVERLQELSYTDAIAEGLIKLPATGRYVIEKGDQYFGAADHDPRKVYRWLWDGLNESRGYGWETNPWVIAVSFTVQHGNIDQVPA